MKSPILSNSSEHQHSFNPTANFIIPDTTDANICHNSDD